jgi:phosphate transport system substrate-binding protein
MNQHPRRRRFPFRTLAALTTLAVVALTAAACGGSSSSSGSDSASSGSDSAASGADLGGKVAIDGSSTVGPITSAIAEDFQKANGGVQVTVGISGTGGGMEKFCKGEIDIADASRPIKDDEKAACTAAGIDFVELKVALDGITNVVPVSNTWATCLTVAQLKAIWDQGSTVKNWSQVDASFPDKPLTLYGPGTASGTFEFFTEAINGVKKQSRTDYTASEDDNVLVQGVSGDEGGLGYFGYGYFEDNTDKLMALGVDAGAGCVAPTPATIKDGTYKPLSRPLFIYVAKKAAARPEVKAFVDYYLANAKSVVADVNIVPLDDPDYAAATTTWTAFAGS